MDSSSNHAEQPQQHDTDPNVQQNVMDPKLRRIFSNRLSAKRSRQKKVKFVENLEDQSKTLQTSLAKMEQVAQLQPQQASHQNQMQCLVAEEQTLLHEMEYLQNKALIRDAEDEKLKEKISRSKEVRNIKQDEFINVDIDLLDVESNDSSSYPGTNIAAEATQMEKAAMAGTHEMMDQTKLASHLCQSLLSHYIKPSAGWRHVSVKFYYTNNSANFRNRNYDCQ
ncbi:unnamed protein product [Sphenostylis stenocarpa]|uniref:BZIP domain-containing protein n=1 Tax=Sphenostylis stenocarpa TaxID=92480 RepID=A0AA86VJB8_9FABA|nr:unnamed protein product [Sphenostylis stenocarpa]